MYVGKTLLARVMEFKPWTSFVRILHRYQITDRPFNRTSRGIAPWNRLQTPCKPWIPARVAPDFDTDSAQSRNDSNVCNGLT